MKKFKFLAGRLFYIFSGMIALIVIVFVGVYLYSVNPSMFESNKQQQEVVTTVNEVKAEWAPKDVAAALAANEMSEEVKYGYNLVTHSSNNMGPAAEEDMQYAGNNLSCTNCHLDFGTKPGSGSWVGVVDRFPQFRGRSNAEGTIEDRINGCMQRSMDGKKLPVDSKPMSAIVAYMTWLGEDLPKEKEKEYKGYVKLEIPEVAVDLEKGKSIYTNQCMVCHGKDGQGQKNPQDVGGYLYPPLWGDDSFNNGAGMHRVITAAEFIKGNMPFGEATRDNPKLTDLEAFNVAGYINSFSRPEKANLDKDYPDLKLKPMSTSYGPYADDFSVEQHKYGPYPPIAAFYKKEYDIKKSK
ncbi:MAG: c-type cytochrome [Salinimicrobium sp.]